MINPTKINIGQRLIHNLKGEITVLGITPHCGDYCVITETGWVYLKNCKLIRMVNSDHYKELNDLW